ncbi:hydroxyethylthiazole kinase [Alkaliphilus serpentinus]|uniref:Hydroxyethylthiazole kinase n=1 Tax=Alkaliphilus serpentinus TaxID=1482731 RepID=A0A833HQ68_9FIRM|nr:hydroxyethylthiazole kinase [Alkaliphilus serpentinus]KAB3531529.1 hydroxyethylthiazole kinase [Alkaliphilus serpentinus]
MFLLRDYKDILKKIKNKKPLIHHITNYVTATDCANTVLALGASAVMADDPLEVEEVVIHSDALVLNMGTLNQQKIEAFILAGRKANDLGIPIILDPVGVGGTKLRSEALKRILKEIKVSVIRGNMSEIKHIYGIEEMTRGVDSISDSKDGGKEISKAIAQRHKCVVAITGEIDYISDGNQTFSIRNGHKMLTNITGTGCMTTSLIGVCCGATKDIFMATALAISIMGIAGERAYEDLQDKSGIGSFKVHLLDAIGGFTIELLEERGRIDGLSY